MDRKTFRDLCAQKIIILDGATGTELQKKGLPAGACPEAWVDEHPDILVDLQKQYIAAGTDILYTSTFGASRLKLKSYGLESEAGALNSRLAALSRQAAESCQSRRIYVAGGFAPTGAMIRPLGDWGFEDIVAVYKEQAEALLAAGVDLFVAETMMSIQEARAALIAVRDLCDLPVMVSVTLEENGRMLTGTDAVTALVTLQSLGADAVGLNCSSGPMQMLPHLAAMKAYAHVPLLAKANAGLPRMVDGQTVFDMTAEDFGRTVPDLVSSGVGILGGCCGTTPAHIQAIAQRAAALAPPAVSAHKPAVVSSAKGIFDFAGHQETIAIGQRINPTNQPGLQKALLDEDYDEIVEIALEQKDEGAQLLDINLGMDTLDEAAAMAGVMEAFSFSVALPLLVDSMDPATVEAALRNYPGRAIVNSVNLTLKSLEGILPVAHRYGAMLIAMPIDDGGLPKSFDDRQRILTAILERAYALGYQKQEIIADVLVLSAAAPVDAVEEALEMIRWCARELKIATIAGICNVSFSLPDREALNVGFLPMAIGSGLTMFIGDTGQSGLMEAKTASDVLLKKRQQDK